MDSPPLLLLSPTRFEARFLTGQPLNWAGGTGLRGEGWVWIESGIGKVNTALALATYATAHLVKRALLFGIAGSYEGSGLEIGHAALASAEIQADLGLAQGGMQAMGFATLEHSGVPYYNRFPLDQAFSQQLAQATKLSLHLFLTRDLVADNPQEAQRLAATHGAVLENMEGAAFAQGCLRLGIAGAQLRSVSNAAGIRDKSQWRIGEAIEALEAYVLPTL